MREYAFAKLNLTLDVIGKRTDGYHELSGVMHLISLCDTVEIKKANGLYVACDDTKIPGGEKNIAYRAAAEFFAAAGLAPCADIKIEKRIPSEAGMGGGSSDAAAVLRALNTLCGTVFTVEQLAAIGASVGADVPFCIMGTPSLARGIGEKLSPVSGLPPCEVLIVKPPEGISTREAFARMDALPPVPENTPRLLKALDRGGLSEIGAAVANAFEDAMSPPAVLHIKDAMLGFGALGASMTGSGTAVFGLFAPDDPAAGACYKAMQKEYREVFICKPVYHS